jgi:hypothetical protein
MADHIDQIRRLSDLFLHSLPLWPFSRGTPVVFGIPATNPETGEQGMMRFRMFTGGAIPGWYRNAPPARVRHKYQLVEEDTGVCIREGYQVHPEVGGTIECQVTYERGPLLHQIADRPNYSLWSAVDASIVRVYQEESVLEILRNDAAGLNVTRDVLFRSTVPDRAGRPV